MPIVEPEVLPDGEHDLATSQKITEQVSKHFAVMFKEGGFVKLKYRVKS